MLNGVLREHTQPEHLGAFLPYLKLLLTGLNKLPLKRVKVYRGVRGDLHEEYNQLQGKVLRWWAFSSTTVQEDTTKTFSGTEGDRTVFGIDAIGVDIAAFSAFPNEAEVLLLPGTALVVEPGVMVEPKYWRFEASVWQAAQQQLRQYQLSNERKVRTLTDTGIVLEHRQHGEDENENEREEGRSDSVVTDRDDSLAPLSRFQNTDLPHPGWEEIVVTKDSRPSTPHTPASTASENSSYLV